MITPTPTSLFKRLRDARRRGSSEQANPMLIRICSGIVGAAVSIFLIFYGNGLAFALGVALFSVVGASEFYRGVRRQGGEPSDFLGFLACIVFQFAAWTHQGQRFAPYLPALLALLVITTLLTELGKRRPKPIINIGATLLGAVYVGWLISYVTLLRGIHAPTIAPPIAGTTPGEWLVIFVLGATWLSDIGALFVGRWLGRHKLAPAISPAKTWEGSVGGIALSLLWGLLLGRWLHLPLEHALGLAALCAIAGQIGDLSESALKRDLGVKDFGALIPGHGGVLDRIDSLLFAAPLAYYYLLYFVLNRHLF